MIEQKRILVLLKGYPRLSETFIAQELLGLERAGYALELVAMRRPTDKKRHPVHDEIQAKVWYLPEYLHEEPWRVAKAFLACLTKSGFGATLAAFWKDLKRDFSRNRFRRLGQAAVLVAEWPKDANWLHVHFIHTPASVARYASMIGGMSWSVSAHAKDIWTSDAWELEEKLHHAEWAVTCTRVGFEHLQTLSRGHNNVHLSYHGLDLERFPHFTGDRGERDGTNPSDPVQLLSVGRAVKKKGYDTLLAALAKLPAGLHWRFTHIGGGDELARLKALAADLGLEGRIEWKGALDQRDVLEHYRRSDLFALACRVTEDGDRDGLPNVMVEAASQGLPVVSTNVSGIVELFENNANALLVKPNAPDQLAEALEQMIRQPQLRRQLAGAAENKVRSDFDYHNSIRDLDRLFSSSRGAKETSGK